jgi:hypothetical protein
MQNTKSERNPTFLSSWQCRQGREGHQEFLSDSCFGWRSAPWSTAAATWGTAETATKTTAASRRTEEAAAAATRRQTHRPADLVHHSSIQVHVRPIFRAGHVEAILLPGMIGPIVASPAARTAGTTRTTRSWTSGAAATTGGRTRATGTPAACTCAATSSTTGTPATGTAATPAARAAATAAATAVCGSPSFPLGPSFLTVLNLLLYRRILLFLGLLGELS